MQQTVSLKLLPAEAADESTVKQYIAQALNVKANRIAGFYFLKKSTDARGKKAWINASLQVFTDEPFYTRTIEKIILKEVTRAKHKVIIIGAGPAGLFAALALIEHGIQPVILERGKNVRARRRDLALLNKEGEINPESNYCFGEGGAGTYSDGKLYTRSSKRGNIHRILNMFVQFGAEEKILYDSHPHIGTNKLPHIIAAIREAIIAYGGQIFFEKKVVDFSITNNVISSVTTQDGVQWNAENIILATGHSARDIFYLLHKKNIQIESKPFALGVRAEHPQQLINDIQYHCESSPINRAAIDKGFLAPASYSLVQQVQNKGVFSFCMCPGGIIAPAATAKDELVVNGWSPSKRNNPFANSGIVVQVEEKDAVAYFKKNKIDFEESNPLLLMQFQQHIEKLAFKEGGGKFVAPAQRMADFCSNKISSSLPACSYLPGITVADCRSILPPFIYSSLQKAFILFGEKMKGYFTNDAIIVATESRTSSPVRIPRNSETLQHVQLRNLYPCGEGAGYAGGIVSAAMDGINVAARIAALYAK